MKVFIINEIAKLLFSLSFALNFILFLPTYFFNAFERYSIYANFPLTKAEANIKFTEILNYLKFPWSNSLDPTFFSPEDLIHMSDVRNLFIVFFILGLIGLFTYLIVMRIKQLTYKPSKNPFIIITVILIVLILIISSNFNAFFIAFHKIFFFYNDYWMLNPATSNLIKYLPESIFLELMLILIGVTGIIYFILTLIQKYGRQTTSTKS